MSVYIEEKTIQKIKIVEEKKPRWVTKIMAESFSREIFLAASLRETIIYIFFVILITIIAMGMIDSSMYYLTKILKDQFVESLFTNQNSINLKFSQIKTAGDFWAYLKTTLLDSFYWEHWYSDLSLPATEEDDRKILYENKMLGVPRLRQLKVLNNSCVVHDYFRRTILSCFGRYNWENRDTLPFGPNNDSAWEYHTPQQTGSPSYWAITNTYDGGGFYQDLTSWKNETSAIIDQLKQLLWITRGTRVVFLDFTVYNANLNLFCVVKIIFEFPPTGGIIPSSLFQTLKLIRYVSTGDYFILGCEGLFALFLVYYTMEEVRTFWYLKRRFLHHFWNFIDLIILVLGYTTVAAAIIRFILAKRKMKEIQNPSNSYINFEMVADWQNHLNKLIAVMLFFIYMKVFKYITFSKTMAQLNNTIKNCAMDVLGFSVMFFIIFMAYAELGYLLFGSHVDQFGSFGTSTFTLLRTILGDFDYMSIERADRILAPIFFLSFIFFVFFILLNMFLAIITDTYGQVKTEIAVAPAEMQMLEFVKKRYFVIMKKMGLGKLVAALKEQKIEFNVTIAEIRGALKKSGFSDLEVEMFFTKFNINQTSDADAYDIKQILDVLEKKAANEGKMAANKDNIREDGTPLVDVDEFLMQRDKIYDVENKISELTEKIEKLCLTLDNMKNVKRIPLP